MRSSPLDKRREPQAARRIWSNDSGIRITRTFDGMPDRCVRPLGVGLDRLCKQEDEL